MSGDQAASLISLDPERVFHRAARHLQRLGMTRGDANALLAVAVPAVANIVSHWLWDDGVTLADVSTWLDQVAASAPVQSRRDITR